MAVAARTYAVRLRGRHSAEGFDLCDTTHCQRLDPSAVTPRRKAAATAGELSWVPGQTSLHAVFKRLWRQNRRCCRRVAGSCGAVFKEPRRSVLHAHPGRTVALERRSATDRTGTPTIFVARTQNARTHCDLRADRVRSRIRTDTRRRRQSIRISASSSASPSTRVGMEHYSRRPYEVHSSNGRLIFEGTGEGFHGVGSEASAARSKMGVAASLHVLPAFPIIRGRRWVSQARGSHGSG